MKRLIAAILLLCMCVGFYGCSDVPEEQISTTQPTDTSSEETTPSEETEPTEKELSYSEMLEIAERVDIYDIYEEAAKNYLKAGNNYVGKCYRIAASVSEICDGYIRTIGFQTASNSILSSEIYFADPNDLFSVMDNGTYDVVGVVSAIEKNKVIFKDAYLIDVDTYNFKLDGIYYSQTGIIDPSKYGITVEESLERNPGRLEENMADDDEIDLFVFATLYAADANGANLYLPSVRSGDLIGDDLALELKIGNKSYDTIYQVNDYENRISKFFDGYDDGLSSLTEDKVLEAGSGDCAQISGLFSVEYGVYKEAIANNTEIILDWGGRYTIAFSGQDIVKIGSVSQIAEILNNQE